MSPGRQPEPPRPRPLLPGQDHSMAGNADAPCPCARDPPLLLCRAASWFPAGPPSHDRASPTVPRPCQPHSLQDPTQEADERSCPVRGGGEPWGPWGPRRASRLGRPCRSGAGSRRLPRRFSPASSSLRSLRKGVLPSRPAERPLTVCRGLGPHERGVRRPAASKAHGGSLTQRASAQQPELASHGPGESGAAERRRRPGPRGEGRGRRPRGVRAEASLGGRCEAAVPCRHGGHLWRTPGKGFGSKFLPRCSRHQ